MDIITVESTTNVCIFGLGIAVLAYGVYKGGTFIERKFDESDRLEKERLNNGNRKQGASRTFDDGIRIRKRA
ncbi:TPA: hypothetical protein ACQ75Q_001452 [Bacillus thuringiensis]|uniref:hypothetical protein n=1 Tax=Bacillus TaxID=1386 RepID=UPI0007C1C185|nr:hypothetical protein [Bacillus thuringiensis]HDR4766302.1 hypothetical protein [Bacillus cereus]AND06618.1 hypothetical protein Bt4C1_05310 [Bacillus thuringiensis serovar alesti]MEC3599642.1 hypothetical protein [Bacillus thuringiensis]MED1838065.1 hypothetical protein [Bacillus thuringiensis]MED2671770.1 hypothetical protein [Bacillus thuringiensis]